jgi:hypothetical protein
MTGGTLNLPAGKLFTTLQMLLAMRTRKLEFAHKFCAVFEVDYALKRACPQSVIRGEGNLEALNS